MGLIHYSCLKNWIQTQRVQKEYGENVVSYYWKKFECEICKQSYPYIFRSKDRLFKLIDQIMPSPIIQSPLGELIQPPAQSYLLLESQPLDKNTSRMIHLMTVPAIQGAKSEFKIGRGHESEVRINDISVSRCHALIKYKAGEGFFIEDNQSKFGTIVLLKDKLQLQANHTLAVQIGRTVVSFTARKVESKVIHQEPERPKPNCQVIQGATGQMALAHHQSKVRRNILSLLDSKS